MSPNSPSLNLAAHSDNARRLESDTTTIAFISDSPSSEGVIHQLEQIHGIIVIQNLTKDVRNIRDIFIALEYLSKRQRQALYKKKIRVRTRIVREGVGDIPRRSSESSLGDGLDCHPPVLLNV